ncbi:synaptonemal complex central element protein 3 isoform X1 [Bubalus kerabau]|uniref:synaptonemal complex central element protein 3 isoform X1 n=1 Tax=Bubalus carabanensis TaxID=3119969 RepID=UPI00244ED5D9|nr:synaptonemal complex central element protein 3 isoform X1 [Bubalus carabanensis]
MSMRKPEAQASQEWEWSALPEHVSLSGGALLGSHPATTSCELQMVQATWMAYDMVVMRTNPALAESMRRLEDAFLNCKEEMEKKWQELLSEAKRAQ